MFAEELSSIIGVSIGVRSTPWFSEMPLDPSQNGPTSRVTEATNARTRS